MDTIKPIDDKFIWTYDKSPLKPNFKSEIDSKHFGAFPKSSSAYRVTSKDHLENDYNRECVIIGRQLDMWVTRATNSVDWMTLSTFESTVAGVRSICNDHRNTTSCQSPVEDYLCLFNKYLVGHSLSKLAGTLKDASNLSIIHHYHSYIVHPDPADLIAARSFLDARDLSSLPQTLWAAYVISTCFLHHPIVKDLIEAAPPLTDSLIKTSPLSKKALKTLRMSLPPNDRDFLSDILRVPSVDLSRPQAYRTHLVLDRARARGNTQQVSALEQLVTPEMIKTFDINFLITSNTTFKNSLFS